MESPLVPIRMALPRAPIPHLRLAWPRLKARSAGASGSSAISSGGSLLQPHPGTGPCVPWRCFLSRWVPCEQRARCRCWLLSELKGQP